MKSGWVYILKCADGSYYVGSTVDLKRRILQHERGDGPRYTRIRRPIELVFAQELPEIRQAFYLEHQLKRWSRAKKEALIRGNWDALALLAKKPGVRTRGRD